jgi:hypothetical protein
MYARYANLVPSPDEGQTRWGEVEVSARLGAPFVCCRPHNITTLSHYTLALIHSITTPRAALTSGEGAQHSIDMPPCSYTVAPADLEASNVGLW